MLTVPEIKQILKDHKFRPKDYMGQNFLVDKDVLDEIVSSADLKSSDEVLEVGPGLGVLTQELAQRTKRVVAVEKDRRFFGILKRQYKSKKNIELINDDILRFHFSEQFQGKYKVVANIPYYLTSKLISLLLTQDKKPELIVLLIQSEVAERAVAKAGELSVLGVSVQFYGDAEVAATVPAESFWPKPEVQSAILRIRPKKKYETDEKLLFWVLKAAFAGKRKQLHNSLSNNLQMPESEINKRLATAKIAPSARPQELTIDDWVRLSKEFKNPA